MKKIIIEKDWDDIWVYKSGMEALKRHGWAVYGEEVEVEFHWKIAPPKVIYIDDNWPTPKPKVKEVEK